METFRQWARVLMGFSTAAAASSLNERGNWLACSGNPRRSSRQARPGGAATAASRCGNRKGDRLAARQGGAASRNEGPEATPCYADRRVASCRLVACASRRGTRETPGADPGGDQARAVGGVAR